MSRRSIILAVLAVMPVAPQVALGAESATSVYLLGSKGSMAGITPPPGTYVTDASYYYGGEASGNAALSLTLRRTGANNNLNGLPLIVDADIEVEGKAYYNIPTVTWVAPQKIMGGSFGASLMLPIGWKQIDGRIDARANVDLPDPLPDLTGGQQLSIHDADTAFGDPLISAFLGWNEGNWHWNVGVLANVPLGSWESDQLANIGFNHWAFDVSAAMTWLDPKIGFEISAAAGFTFNTENPDTDYKSGTDFHVEFALMQHLSKQFAIGATGYHYQQITGDSGAGAVLGDFKGRVTGVGPAVNATFVVGQLPVMTSLKWIHEFESENRLEGDMGFLTITIPLGPPPVGP